ncbi:MAG TPA: Na+-transporting NADH:ubiquinone oxidoreductase subunit D [Ruminococcaceae bacterium]|nr:Na+-transporting NADH:ubiquinone oxidoreductase subunit D [Oscillospiraceae bacterium]
MSELLIEPSPHIRSDITTQKIMLDVLIALFPSVIAGTVIFGLRALVLVVLCAFFCVIFEYLFNLVTKRRQTLSDLSAVVTGVLLGMNLPPTLPIYMAAIGSFAAIIIVKQFFGGLGQNFANPAITARIILMLSFGRSMTSWTAPIDWAAPGTDAVSSATPLASQESLPSYLDMFLGLRAGCIGETCIAALLIGGLYLIIRGIIDPVTPAAFIGTVAVCSILSGHDVLMQLMSGGLVLGAFFMATDYATTPLTRAGKLIFGIGCGLITSVIRFFGVYPEGVSFSILIMNIITPLIDRYVHQKPFGAKKEALK